MCGDVTMKMASENCISLLRRGLKLVLVTVFGLLTITGCGGGGGSDATSPSAPVVPNTDKAAPIIASTGVFQQTVLASRTIGESGGTIEITDTSSPMKGLKIIIPEDAASEDINFEISFADISNMTGLPEGASPTSQMIKIEAKGSDAWNRFSSFNKPVQVTLPYLDTEDVVSFYALSEEGILEPVGIEGVDSDNNTITFSTRTFSGLSNWAALTGSVQNVSLKALALSTGVEGPTVLVEESTGGTFVTEWGPTADHIYLSLNTQPTADVVISIDHDEGQLVVTPTTLTFTADNWNKKQRVAIVALSDGTNEQNPIAREITFTSVSSDTAYNDSVIDPVVVTIYEVSVPHMVHYVAVGIQQQKWAEWSRDGFSIDTGFRPGRHDLYIPNWGSAFLPATGGHCWGMTQWARWYYKRGFSPNLYDNYRDPVQTETWLDDATAIELSSRMQGALDNLWTQFVNTELLEQGGLQPGTVVTQSMIARSFVGAMYVNGQPAQMAVRELRPIRDGGWWAKAGHAILVYRVDIDTNGNFIFHVYDPNYSADITRRVQYSVTNGFQVYYGGTTAADSGSIFNEFKHINYNLGVSDTTLEAIKRGADMDFANDSLFPRITVTEIKGKNNAEDLMANTGTTDDGQPKYTTSDTAITLDGTVLGGIAQNPDNPTLYLWTNNTGVFKPAVFLNNLPGEDGSFKNLVNIDLRQGDNLIALLANADPKEWIGEWAAFKFIIVESTASQSDMAITLSWAQDKSDVDLYIKEPDGESVAGETVYYQNRRSLFDSSPYLDFDNTVGFGPEHYIGSHGDMTQYIDNNLNPDGLYGDYTVKVHYFSDKDDDTDNTQAINWTVRWRYLAYCVDPCISTADEFWKEGSKSGSLTSATSFSNCCDIDNSGPDWSDSFVIEYDKPRPEDFVLPAPIDLRLP